MGRGQGRPQRLYSGVERRPAISMKSKKKFMILWVLLIAVLFAGSLLTAPPGKTETIQTAMRDAVLHPLLCKQGLSNSPFLADYDSSVILWTILAFRPYGISVSIWNLRLTFIKLMV